MIWIICVTGRLSSISLFYLKPWVLSLGIAMLIKSDLFVPSHLIKGRGFPAIFWIAFLFMPGNVPAAQFNIGPDDILRISVYGYDDFKTETRVSEDGRITFPLIGEVDVSGKSTFQLEKMISTLLSDGHFIQDAQVSVTVMEYNSQRVSVLGEVNAPGRYPLDTAATLVDVIAMAGGIKDTGDEKAVVTRFMEGKAEKKEIDLHEVLDFSGNSEPLEIRQGDLIYIPKAPVFYIYGEVQRPGSYRVERNIT
ncbi:MAG: polysaccharide biosynthesis/export family protein, partial [Methylococcales bacterium]